MLNILWHQAGTGWAKVTDMVPIKGFGKNYLPLLVFMVYGYMLYYFGYICILCWILTFTMDSATVSKKLKSGDFKVKKSGGVSKVWETFGIVVNSEGAEVDHVACKKCDHVLVYKKGKTGTSTMAKHKCGIIARGQPVLLPVAAKVMPSPQPTTPTPDAGKIITQVKATITTACVDYCAEDLRPFDAVAGQGFLDLIDVVSV